MPLDARAIGWLTGGTTRPHSSLPASVGNWVILLLVLSVIDWYFQCLVTIMSGYNLSVVLSPIPEMKLVVALRVCFHTPVAISNGEHIMIRTKMARISRSISLKVEN